MSTHTHTILGNYALPTQCTNCARLEDEDTQLAEVGKHDMSCSQECTGQLCFESCTASGKKDMRMLVAALYMLQKVQLDRIPLDDYDLGTAVIKDDDGMFVRFAHMERLKADAMALLGQFGSSDTPWQETIWADVEELQEKLGVSL